MNNEPAFFITAEHGANSGAPGMTLRDYFAAQAMQGAIASLKDGDDFTERGCEWAYKVADEMLKARKK